MSRLSRFDLCALALLALIAVYSFVRIPYLPQFVDGYYHLSVANGFIKSGGWSFWAWWDFAPLGRPHLYPPLYHLFLTGIMKMGLSGIFALQLTEGLIVPLFFSIFWFVVRGVYGYKAAFFSLLALSGYFPFYTCVSGNVPASIALILGLLSFYFFINKKNISAIVCLTAAFYSHAGIPWIFFIGYIFALADREIRFRAGLVVFASISLGSVFLWHEYLNAGLIHITSLGENNSTCFSLVLIIAAVGGILVYKDRFKMQFLFILGMILGCFLIFLKYEYRMFSAQGMIGFAVFSGIFIAYIYSRLPCVMGRVFAAVAAICLFLFYPGLERNEGKLNFNFFPSTYYRLSTGAISGVMFESMYSPRLYAPSILAIDKYSQPDDIIVSNMKITGQIYAALTNRANAYSMLGEVKAPVDGLNLRGAKIFIWSNQAVGENPPKIEASWLKEVSRTEIDTVFLNTLCVPKAVPRGKVIPFSIVFIFILLSISALYLDIKKPMV